ncbi:MAG: hypothetical protein M1835_006926 [Candelina submexicana]|nr:MAG: hypothetical protein M1835_006926 [Candelina submexicana]
MFNKPAIIHTIPPFTETSPLHWRSQTTEMTVRAHADAHRLNIRRAIAKRRSASAVPNLQHMQIWIDEPADNDARPETIASLRHRGMQIALDDMGSLGDMEAFDDSDAVMIDSDPEDERVMVDPDVYEYESDEDVETVCRRRRQIHEGPPKPEPGRVAGLVAHPVSVAVGERVREGLMSGREMVTERLIRSRGWRKGIARDVYGRWRAFRDEGGLKMMVAYFTYESRRTY